MIIEMWALRAAGLQPMLPMEITLLKSFNAGWNSLPKVYDA
jgi:hypothetical protein